MISARHLIATGSPFERTAGYSRAVVDGPWCFVSGTTGYDYRTMVMPDDAGAQAENILRTIERVLGEAGFGIGDIVRMRYIVTDRAHAGAVFSTTGRWFSDVRPAATLIVAGLLEPEMKVEMEATAYRPDRSALAAA